MVLRQLTHQMLPVSPLRLSPPCQIQICLPRQRQALGPLDLLMTPIKGSRLAPAAQGPAISTYPTNLARLPPRDLSSLDIVIRASG